MRSQVTGHRSQVTGLVCSMVAICLGVFELGCSSSNNASTLDPNCPNCITIINNTGIPDDRLEIDGHDYCFYQFQSGVPLDASCPSSTFYIDNFQANVCDGEDCSCATTERNIKYKAGTIYTIGLDKKLDTQNYYQLSCTNSSNKSCTPKDVFTLDQQGPVDDFVCPSER